MSAVKKDMRRPDLVVPYQAPAKSAGDQADFSSTISSTLPMAAIFTRNKYLGWASLVFALQNWLGESEGSASAGSSTPGYFSVGMSAMSLAITYLPLFLPQPPNQRAATSTGPAAPAAA
ncbi:PAT complex subunit Asterix [Microdochium nivale]|nr:PAT complex subunit Asterix [Microdochium nivale]